MNGQQPIPDDAPRQIMGVARLLGKQVTILYEAGGKVERRDGMLESIGPWTTILTGATFISIRSETIVEIAQSSIVPVKVVPGGLPLTH